MIPGVITHLSQLVDKVIKIASMEKLLVTGIPKLEASIFPNSSLNGSFAASIAIHQDLI